MAAVLMTMMQCRKQETMPSANTIKMTITAGPGAKTDITDEGAITWSKDDVLYVSDGTKWLGRLNLQSGVSSASGTFTGTIASIGEGTTTCHFFYLGHDNGMAAPTANTTTDVSISFASQDGTRGGALKYHLGHGSANVTVREGEATGAVRMSTKIAIAHINFTVNSQPYTGAVKMTGVSSTMTVTPAGTFSGGGSDGITIGNNGGSGDRYVTLIPEEASSVDVSFNDGEGSLEFGHGIRANNLYGMATPIPVALTPSHDYVDLGLSSGLLWAKCNLGASKPEDYGRHFMWGSTTSGGDSFCKWVTCPGNGSNFSYNESAFNTWKSSHLTDGVLNPDVDAAAELWGGAWRMPTIAEWEELHNGTTSAWTDNYDNTGVAGQIFTSKTNGKVLFLPAAGYCRETSVINAGSGGSYWSSSLDSSDPSSAYYMYFSSGFVSSQFSYERYCGFSVRPVR